jgi:hypothetical protein
MTSRGQWVASESLRTNQTANRAQRSNPPRPVPGSIDNLLLKNIHSMIGCYFIMIAARAPLAIINLK